MKILVLGDHYTFKTICLLIQELSVGSKICERLIDSDVYDDFDIIFTRPWYLPIDTCSYVVVLKESLESIDQVKEVINDFKRHASNL